MKTSITILFAILCLSVSAQNKLSDRIYFGGGFGFNAGNNVANVSVSPQVGYKITDRFLTGVGVIYQYVKFRPADNAINNYGWNVFSRYGITQQIFAHTEFERLDFEYFTSFAPEQTERSGYNSVLLGGGYSEPLSGNAALSFSILYNVLYDPADSPRPYNSPWVIRGGIGLGF